MNHNILIGILVVEDEVIVAKSIEKILKDAGYFVVGIASSGKQAIEQAAHSQPDLVLMDIKLKGLLDGVSTAQRIQSLLDIPVVYLTALSDQETLKRVVHSGPYGFILKPFKEYELLDAVQKALHRHEIKQGTKNRGWQ